jgi:hypothetical protein
MKRHDSVFSSLYMVSISQVSAAIILGFLLLSISPEVAGSSFDKVIGYLN